MVISVPIAGWENSKRCSGLAGGLERQAERSIRAASSGNIRNAKTEARSKPEGANAADPTPNIQHPTSNIQHPIVSNRAVTGHRTFGVRWQEFPGFIGIG